MQSITVTAKIQICPDDVEKRQFAVLQRSKEVGDLKSSALLDSDKPPPLQAGVVDKNKNNSGQKDRYFRTLPETALKLYCTSVICNYMLYY